WVARMEPVVLPSLVSRRRSQTVACWPWTRKSSFHVPARPPESSAHAAPAQASIPAASTHAHDRTIGNSFQARGIPGRGDGSVSLSRPGGDAKATEPGWAYKLAACSYVATSCQLVATRFTGHAGR